jgi:hypothetical protein
MGGGGSTKTEYPGYMKNWHQTWLSAINSEMVTALAAGSPLLTISLPDVGVYFGTPEGTVYGALDTFTHMDIDRLWNMSYEAVVSGNVFQDAVKVFTDAFHEQAEEKLLPEFKAGMRNINAVQTSQFVIGESIIHSTILRQAAQHATDLQKVLLNICQNITQMKVQAYKDTIHYILETSRLNLAALHDRNTLDIKIKEDSSNWRLDMYEHAARMLGSINGSAVPVRHKGSPIQSALAGAASGAAMGSAMGPLGAAAGGVIGAAGGYFSNK